MLQDLVGRDEDPEDLPFFQGAEHAEAPEMYQLDLLNSGSSFLIPSLV